MKTPRSGKLWRISSPIMWGGIATFVILALAVCLAFEPACLVGPSGGLNCNQPKWLYFLNATPNEVGDALAGFAGTLAFVWLIVTVWLQGQELSAQREELGLTRKEFKKMAEAQSKQVEVLEAQKEIFLGEQQQREQNIAHEELDELLKLFVALAEGESENGKGWGFPHSGVPGDPGKAFFPWLKKESKEDYIREVSYTSASFLRYCDVHLDRDEVGKKSIQKSFYQEIATCLAGIVDIEVRLSKAQLIRLQNLKVKDSLRNINVLLEADIWEESSE